MTNILEIVNGIVWGIPALLLIIGVGLYLSAYTGWSQLSLLPEAFRRFARQLRKPSEQTGVSGFRALCTALAATVGTGNIAGVAGAISLGGPGAVFWMWICGLLGMVTKFAEATLAVRYRSANARGEWVGGPMYMIKNGMGPGFRFLASIYCFLGVVAALGVGNATQINAVVSSVRTAVTSFGGEPGIMLNLGIGLAVAVLAVFLLYGGVKRIGTVTEFIVPFAACAYLILSIGVLLCCANAIPGAFAAIVRGAFTPTAVTGGVLGSAFRTLRIGASRGVFTNEAGMGTASIAHAAADVDHPVQQGLMGIIEVFLDTIVICTMTALVILCSGVPIPYGTDAGAVLTTQAFATVYGSWVSLLLAGFICCFAVATVFGWGLYGVRCMQYIFGEASWKRFAFLQAVAVMAGAVLKTEAVWTVSEIVNGLMAIPNLIVLAYLCPEFLRLINEYQQNRVENSTYGGTYANINQCKSMRTVTYAEVSSACCCGKETGENDLPFEYWSTGSADTSSVL